MSNVRPIPEGYHSVTPYLVTSSVPQLLEFVQAAFDAEVQHRMEMPDGSIMHAEVRIGDSPVMMGQANEGSPARPGMLYLYVEDCDAAYRKAVDAGAKPVREPADQFYGDRSGGVEDPVGNQWWFGSHIEDVSPDEMRKRAAEARGGG